MSKVKGCIYDAELCKPLAGVDIVKLNADNIVVEATTSKSRGCWSISPLKEGERIVFKKSGFISKEYAHSIPTLIRLLNDRLIGYQDRLWFLPGQEVNVYVQSKVPFDAKLFRHGLEKELVFDVGEYPVSMQAVDDNYFVEKGLNWEKSFSYKLSDIVAPGLYSLMLENNAHEKFAIPFIISNASPKEQILVLASTNTWQSYNIWGGRNRYRSFEDNAYKDGLNIGSFFVALLKNKLPKNIKNFIRKLLLSQTEGSTWRFKHLSIRRPFTNCDLEDDNVFNEFCNHLAAGEWRLLAWLEQQGFGYDIISGVELHNNPEVLKNYKAVILSTHCEYWSGKMYDGLKNAHEQGAWIVNLSGNSIFRLIDIFDNGDTRCVDLSFKNGYSDETQLLGVRFSLDDYGTCAPYKILQPHHWVFDGLDLKDRFFGHNSLNCNVMQESLYYNPGRPGLRKGLLGEGSSGWETDKLSKGAPSDFIVVARGTNKYGGADMVVRDRIDQGGGVFSASSIVFGASLLIDNVASKIVKNVIEKAINK